MNKNENKIIRQKLFFAFLVAGIVLAAILQMLWIPDVQQRILELVESMIGRSLRRPEKWIAVIKRYAIYGSLLLLSFSFCFYRFEVYASSCEQKTNLKQNAVCNGRGYFKGYACFLKNHNLLCLFTVLVMLAVYGIRLFSLNIGIDTGLAFSNKVLNWREIGRFGLVFLKQFQLFGLNLYLQNFLALAFLSMGTLSWAYFISLFFPEKNKSSFFVFVAFFVSSQVWVESLYFTCMNAETAFLIFICPFVAFLMFFGVFENNRKSIIASVIALVFMTAIYQAVIVMFFCALMIGFAGYSEQKNHSEKDCVIKGVKIAFLMLISLLIYFALDKFFITAVFRTEKSDYLTNNISKSIFRKILSPAIYADSLLEMNPIEMFFLLVFPICVGIAISMKKGFVHLLSFFAILVSVFMLPFVGGGGVTMRAQYALPLVEAFFIMFALENTGGRFRKILLAVCSIICAFQIERSSMINYTDELRFLQDKNLALNIARAVQKSGASEQVPVFIYGKYSPVYASRPIVEVPEHSIFEWGVKEESPLDAMHYGVSFINSLGFHFRVVGDAELIQKARREARAMPDFPAEGSVRNLGDVVVVRLSESPFVDAF